MLSAAKKTSNSFTEFLNLPSKKHGEQGAPFTKGLCLRKSLRPIIMRLPATTMKRTVERAIYYRTLIVGALSPC